MKQLLSGWSVMRVLRLVMGGIAIWQSIAMHEWPLALAGGLLVIMAFANVGCCGTGCCGTGGCAVPPPRTTADQAKEDSQDHRRP